MMLVSPDAPPGEVAESRQKVSDLMHLGLNGVMDATREDHLASVRDEADLHARHEPCVGGSSKA